MARLAVAALLLFVGLSARADAAAPKLRPCERRRCADRSNGRSATGARSTSRSAGTAAVATGRRSWRSRAGPGYPSTGSRWEYRGIFGPLIRSRGLLLVDNRGTGESALIDCKSVQAFAGRTSGRAFARRVGRCAAEIDARYGRGAHSFFATAYAADDLAAVLRALRLGEGRPLRRLVRHVLRAGVHGAAPVDAALGRAGLAHTRGAISTPGTRPRAPRRGSRWRRSRRARWRVWARCWSGCGRRRSPARRATPTRASCPACASTRACSPTWSRTARRTR